LFSSSDLLLSRILCSASACLRIGQPRIALMRHPCALEIGMTSFLLLSFHLQAKLSSGSLLDMAETIATSYLIAGSNGWKSSTKSSSRQRAPNLVRYMSSYSGVCSAVKYSAVSVQFSSVQCSAVQCSAVQYQYSTVQCSAVQCSISTVQCSAVQCSAVQYNAVQCSAVQCSAVQCSTVQCSAVQCSISTVQCSAVHCSAVQYQYSAVQYSAVQ
jgi:hypothetical protein